MNAEERAEILKVLQSGRMETEGLLPWSSNYAFLVQVCEAASELRAVYKPNRGERPLWDFPTGTLSSREYAAFLISDELGWNLVPPTVIRDGEHGPGTVQLFIEHDPDQHYFSFEGQPEFRMPLQKIVLLDVVINNADRKGGHVIIEENRGNEDIAGADGPGRLWGIDHGICFHHDNKLRTVIWEFAGMEIPQSLLSDLERLDERLTRQDGVLPSQLHPLLNEAEIAACEKRLQTLIRRRIFPNPGPGRHYPWPPV
jgi:uncharacterized repeat protein (TIGR03843 family)